jgi:hypothetical protein
MCVSQVAENDVPCIFACMSGYSQTQFATDFRRSATCLEGNLRLRLFSASVKISFYGDPPTGLCVSIVEDLVQMGPSHLEPIKALLLFDYMRACTMSDWGSGRGKDNPFGIATPEDAYAQAKLNGVVIDRPQRFRKRWACIEFTPAWEMEHGVFIALRNGVPMHVAQDCAFPNGLPDQV